MSKKLEWTSKSIKMSNLSRLSPAENQRMRVIVKTEFREHWPKHKLKMRSKIDWLHLKPNPTRKLLTQSGLNPTSDRIGSGSDRISVRTAQLYSGCVP